ncbi:MAG: amidohydrolase family protein [Lachnospiraceae bacterium]|nr:amidohydrolase family protein [Lachnospiraceae bacterium]
MLNILIKNGRIFDPSTGRDEIGDIAIDGERIVSAAGATEAAQVIDASGCYVFPGLIDFHTHLFEGGSTICASPAVLPPMGVTSAVDAGSAGVAEFEIFCRDIIRNAKPRIKAFVNCYTGGLPDYTVVEDFSQPFNVDRLRKMKARHPEEMIGLKMRLSYNQNLTKDLDPLRRAVAAADEIGDLAVCVHVTNPSGTMEEIVNILRPGDILCHVYHGQGDTILTPDGRVKEGILAAREKGVIYDLANGRKNYAHRVAEGAIAQGFFPDVVSTDLTCDKAFYHFRVRSLPFVMSKMLGFGMDFTDLIRAVTETPAKLMHMEGQIGTLREGAFGDVTIMTLEDVRTIHEDFFEEKRVFDKLFVPQMTIIGGTVYYGAPTFDLPGMDDTRPR